MLVLEWLWLRLRLTRDGVKLAVERSAAPLPALPVAPVACRRAEAERASPVRQRAAIQAVGALLIVLICAAFALARPAI